MKSQEIKYTQELISVLAKIGASDKKLLKAFLVDLLTPAEYREIGLRWQIVQMLHKGMPQRQIAEKLGISVATVGRGSRELLDPKGGFTKVLLKLKK
jgi:TrpR family transcriptional regulator, trp operon repressor